MRRLTVVADIFIIFGCVEAFVIPVLVLEEALLVTIFLTGAFHMSLIPEQVWNSRRRRSLCQEFCFSLPRGLQRSIFLLQQVPRLEQRYHFIAFPSLPTKIHHWHWLRSAKNLLMCLNYLRLMLGASVCSGALGWHYSCDGNSLRSTAFHPIWLHSRERCHGAQRLRIHWLFLKLW